MNDHAGGGLPAAGPPSRSADRRRAPLPTRFGSLPALPPEFRRALDDGVAALGLPLSPTARRAIDAHARLLLAWNAAINLTAITDPGEIAHRHVVDSLSAVPLVAATGRPVRLLDLGSGGGYPGLPIVAALPVVTGLLVESVGKKARFLEAAVEAAGLGSRLSVAARRGEHIAAEVGAGRLEPFDVVTARAIGALAELVELALPVLGIGGRLIAWKRGDLAPEVAAGARAAAALGGSRPAVHEVPGATGLAGHRLIVVEKRRPTPTGHPREPARRRARPW